MNRIFPILQHISLSLIEMARNPKKTVKMYKIWYQNEGNNTYFPIIWITDTLEVPNQH